MAETETGMIVDHPLAARAQCERDGLLALAGDLERIEYIADSFLLMKKSDPNYVPDFSKPELGEMGNDIARIADHIRARIEGLTQLDRELRETVGLC